MNLDPLTRDDDPSYHFCPFCAALCDEPHELECPYSSTVAPAEEPAE